MTNEKVVCLPDGWKSRALGEYARLVKGITYTSSQYCEPGKGAAFLTIKSIEKGGGYKTEGLKFYKGPIAKKQLLSKGDLLIANTDLTRDGDIVGCATVVPELPHEACTMSMDLSKVEVDPNEADIPFVGYLFSTETARKFMKDNASGSTVLHLKTSAVPSLRLPMPNSLGEQRRIAELLSTLDEQIEQTEALLEKLSSITEGAFDDLFGQAFKSALSRNSLRVGALKNNWERIPLALAAPKILDFRGRTPLKLGMMWGGGDIPALSANNVEMGRVNFQKESYLGSMALYKKWMTQGECEKDDVLMTLEAPLGNIALVPDEKPYILSQRVILLKPAKDLFINKYLYFYLRWRRFQALLLEESTGTTATGIQRKKLERLPVLLPPKDEDRRIVEILSTLLENSSVLTEKAEKLKLKKIGLMSDLLTGNTRFPS